MKPISEVVSKGLAIGLLFQAATTGYALEVTATPDTDSGFKVETQDAAHPTPQEATAPAPSPTPGLIQPTAESAAAGWACFGTAHGASCLDPDGKWSRFTADESPLSNNDITDVAVCPGGLALFAHEDGVDVFDGSNWKSYSKKSWDQYGRPTTLACDGRKGYWVGHSKGAAHFDGTTWKNFEEDRITPGRALRDPKQIKVAPDDVTWLATTKTIARFDNGAWTSYKPGKGMPNVNYSFDAISIDGDGRPQAMEAPDGFLTFDGEGWSFEETELIDDAATFEFGQQNRKWVASEHDGLQLVDGQSVTLYNRDNSELTSNAVRALAVDAASRVWLGTDWGLNVLDNGQWTAYQMHTSDLPDNAILHVAVAGAGPRLPVPAEKQAGSLTGRLVRHGKPVPGAQVEVCAQTTGMFYRGASPCANQPAHFHGPTDDDGHFRLTGVPTGRYVFFFNEDRRWTRLGKGVAGMQPVWQYVQPGQDTDMGDLEIARPGNMRSDAGFKLAAPSVPDVEITQPSIPTPKIPQPTVPSPELPRIDLPGATIVGKEGDLIITIASQVLFDFDQHSLRPDAETTLGEIAPILAGEFSTRKVHIEGHTDSKGTSEYNQILSERRAAAVKDWLGTRGKIAAERMESVGHGESRPVAPNRRADGADNPEGRRQNRRVELVLNTDEPK